MAIFFDLDPISAPGLRNSVVKAMTLTSLEQIVAALNSAGVRYLVVGGLAVAAHGYGRLTIDDG